MRCRVGRWLRYFVRVANYPLTPEQIREWAELVTFDMFGPVHKYPHTSVGLREWCDAAGLVDVTIERIGHIVARGRAPVQRGL